MLGLFVIRRHRSMLLRCARVGQAAITDHRSDCPLRMIDQLTRCFLKASRRHLRMALDFVDGRSGDTCHC